MEKYEDLSKYKNVAIYTYIDDCRRCFTLKDFTLKKYAFDECSLDNNSSQRFDIYKGKSNDVFSYKITISGNSNQIISGTNSDEFYILPSTSDVHGETAVNIIEINSSKCFAETYINSVFPYTQDLNTFFEACNNTFNSKTQKFYFHKGLFSKMLYKGTISFFEFNTSVTQATIDLININYSQFRVYYSTSSSSDKNLSFAIMSPNVTIELPQHLLDYNVYNNMNELNNPSFYCYFIVTNSNSNKMILPFYNKSRCSLNYPNYFHMDINIVRYNKTEFNIFNTTREIYMSTTVFADNSNIIFTSSSTSFSYNVATNNVNNFIRPLEYGNYTAAVTLKTNPDMDSFQGLSFTINNCNYTLVTIPVKEKIVKATITFKDYLTNNNLTTSYYVNNTNINFVRTTTGVNYPYNVGSVGQSSIINHILHFGTYTVSSTEITEWEEYTTSITVNGYSDILFTLFLREKKVYATFTIKNIADNSNLSTSQFNLNSNITFNRTSTGVNTLYNVGSGNQVSFSLWLYFGTYNIYSDENPEWLRLTNSITITSYSDINFNIFLEIKTINVTFSIINQTNNWPLNSACFPLGNQIAFRNHYTDEYTYYNNNSKVSSFVVALKIAPHDIMTAPSQENQEGCGGAWGYKKWNLSTTSLTVTKTTVNFTIILFESTINVTFEFRVSNLGNTYTNTCFLPQNTLFTFYTTYESGQSLSINKYISCSSNFSVTLTRSVWSISFISEYDVQNIIINNNQTFNITSYSNQTQTIYCTKFLQMSYYLKYTPPSDEIENLGNITIECPNYQVLTYFHAAPGHSNIMNFWYFCKDINTNGTVNNYVSNSESYSRDYLAFWKLGFLSFNCNYNEALKKFRILYDMANLTFKFEYSCVQINSTSLSGVTSHNDATFPYLSAGNGNFYTISNLRAGNISNCINSIHIFGGNDIRTLNFIIHNHFVAQPVNVIRYELSNNESSTFYGVSLNEAICPTNFGLTFYAHVHTGSQHKLIYMCRELISGYVGSITSDTHTLTWQPGRGSNIYYDRQWHDCGNNKVTKSRKLLYDLGSGNMMKEVECYEYNAPKRIVNYSWPKNDCSDDNQNKLNGFTWGDGINFITSMTMTMYESCSTTSKVFVPLL